MPSYFTKTQIFGNGSLTAQAQIKRNEAQNQNCHCYTPSFLHGSSYSSKHSEMVCTTLGEPMHWYDIRKLPTGLSICFTLISHRCQSRTRYSSFKRMANSTLATRLRTTSSLSLSCLYTSPPEKRHPNRTPVERDSV